VYSYRNATEVVEAFTTKYARVLLFIARTYGKEPRALKEKLKIVYMKNNTKWNVVRDFIKKLEKTEEIAYLSSLPVPERKSYLHMLRTFAEDSVIEPENWL